MTEVSIEVAVELIVACALASRTARYVAPEPDVRFEPLMEALDAELKILDHESTRSGINHYEQLRVLALRLRFPGSDIQQFGQLLRIVSAFHIGGPLPRGLHRLCDELADERPITPS